jgi:hypothetical protein
MLYTLIEPHPGRHRAYNRWYERDHFYSGVLTLPGSVAGQRWVATPELKARRLPMPSPVVPDPGRGSFLTTYYVDASRIPEWDVAAGDAVRDLQAAGRMWPERDHVLTRFVDYEFAAYRDTDPVPALLTLDHRYPGLVTVVGRGVDGVDRSDVHRWLREDVLPDALQGSPVASVLTFSFRPIEGERPPDLVRDEDPATRFYQLWFVEADPNAVWDDVFVPLAAAVDASGVAVLEWMGGFVPTVPGTDTHVDALEAAEVGAPSGPTDPAAVIAEYFARVRARDPRLTELFHDHSRLIGLGTVTEGRIAIDAFYADVAKNAAPVPRLVGPLMVDGPRVAAEIFIDLANGTTIHVIDLFVVDDGRITSLTYFLADH